MRSTVPKHDLQLELHLCISGKKQVIDSRAPAVARSCRLRGLAFAELGDEELDALGVEGRE